MRTFEQIEKDRQRLDKREARLRKQLEQCCKDDRRLREELRRAKLKVREGTMVRLHGFCWSDMEGHREVKLISVRRTRALVEVNLKRYSTCTIPLDWLAPDHTQELCETEAEITDLLNHA